MHDPKPYAVPCLCSSLPPCCELSWALCSLSWPSPTGGSDCVYSRIDCVRESGGENVWSCWLEVSLTACAMATRSRTSWGQSPLLDSCPDPSWPSLLASGGSPLFSLQQAVTENDKLCTAARIYSMKGWLAHRWQKQTVLLWQECMRGLIW